MILSFKKQFTELIVKRDKIHTIREDPTNRWKAGNKIHFATGVRTKHYNQFAAGKCHSVQYITILWEDRPVVYIGDSEDSIMPFYFKNDDVTYGAGQMLALVKNDGFASLKDFFEWFSKDIWAWKIIHWTDLKYD